MLFTPHSSMVSTEYKNKFSAYSMGYLSQRRTILKKPVRVLDSNRTKAKYEEALIAFILKHSCWRSSDKRVFKRPRSSDAIPKSTVKNVQRQAKTVEQISDPVYLATATRFVNKYTEWRDSCLSTKAPASAMQFMNKHIVPEGGGTRK